MGKMKFRFDVRFEEEDEEEYGRRSHKRQQLKACSSSDSEKVCFVLEFEPFDGYYVFVSDVSLSNNTRNTDLVPLVHLKCLERLSMLGLDSTLYMVNEYPPNYRPGDDIPVQPVYALDLQHYIDLQQHDHTTNYIKTRHLRTLPPMSCPKERPAIHPVPNSKNICVFSTYLDLCQTVSDLPDNVPATPRDYPFMVMLRADFEIYDADTKSWLTLPRFCIRPVRKLASTPIFQLFDPLTHSWNKIDFDYSRLVHYEYCALDITGFAFINDHTLVVDINAAFRLTLDLSSLARGWIVLHKEEEEDKEKENKKKEVFIFKQTRVDDWCAFDIDQYKLVPPSAFRHRVEFTHHKLLLMTRVGTGNRVCVLKTGLRRRKRYPQMVVDVVDVEEDEVRGKPVACFKSQFKKRCSYFVSKCLFVYRPRRCDVMTDRDL